MTLELRNVVQRVGAETHIYGANLTLAESGFNVLLGATGAGKTTLIKLMAGLEKPSSGAVLMNGKDVTGVSPQKRRVALVHQFFINYPNMTVRENIASPLRVARLERAEIERRVGETAELLRLTPMLDRHPHELSGGQQQRTALARAIVKDSELVLLDEPLANLDYKLREELRDQLPQLFAGRGAIVVYATSEPAEALLLGGHTATVKEGRITEFGETSALYRRPGDLETADIFSDPPINFAPVRKEAGEIVLEGGIRWPARGEIARAPDGDYTLGLRPHFVTPEPAGEQAVPISGRILITELSGSESVAHFALGGGNGAGSGARTWVSHSHGVHSFAAGETHKFHLDTSGCLYFGADGGLVASGAAREMA